jgi:HK97 family phage major capsid protein
MTETPNPVLVELKRISTEISGTLETQNAEIKKAGETSTETAKKLSDLEAKYEGIQQDIKGQIQELEAKSQRLGLGERGEIKTAGQQFVESGSVKSARDAGGNIRIRVEMKALTGAADSVGSTVRPQRLPLYTPPSAAHIRDLFAQGQTDSGMLEFPQIKAWTNNAAVVADQPSKANAILPASYKPESDLATELMQFPVRTIAHLIRAHKNILDDEPAIRSLIDQKLLEGLDDAVDVELIGGDGTGNHVKGVLANARTFTRAAAGDTKIDVIRRSLTDLRLKNYRADGIVVNPLDWEDMELLKGTDGKYIWVDVNNGGVPRLWRVPVVDTIAVEEGQFISGAFKQGGQVFDRQHAAVEVFEQDRDNVPLNLVTFRAELRLALVIYDQNAFVKGTYPA